MLHNSQSPISVTSDSVKTHTRRLDIRAIGSPLFPTITCDRVYGFSISHKRRHTVPA